MGKDTQKSLSREECQKDGGYHKYLKGNKTLLLKINAKWQLCVRG